MYLERKFDIRDMPRRSSPKYEPWCEDIYYSKGQIGLKVELMSVMSDVGWTNRSQGTFSTKEKS